MAKQIDFYYTNARFNRKTALLAGPFLTVAEAEHFIDILQPVFEAEVPEAAMATFGVMSCKAFAGYGIYNLALKANGVDVPIPEGNQHEAQQIPFA